MREAVEESDLCLDLIGEPPGGSGAVAGQVRQNFDQIVLELGRTNHLGHAFVPCWRSAKRAAALALMASMSRGAPSPLSSCSMPTAINLRSCARFSSSRSA